MERNSSETRRYILLRAGGIRLLLKEKGGRAGKGGLSFQAREVGYV